MNLRWIERQGERILQQEVEIDAVHNCRSFKWQDVPVHKEPEQQKPREFFVDPNTGHTYNQKPDQDERYIHVIQVFPGHKLISRDEVERAWERYDLDLSGSKLRHFLDCLGFDYYV